jgi:hypothetical protein
VNEKPVVDINKAVDEIKNYMNTEKMNMIDWDKVLIEVHLDPNEATCPEISKFAGQWEEVFSHADKVTLEDGTGFPHEIVKAYDAVVEEIQDLVNADTEFWKEIRAVVLPLYPEKTKDCVWDHIVLFYDAVGMDVSTKMVLRDPKTNEVKRTEVVSQQYLPPGFVIRISGK